MTAPTGDLPTLTAEQARAIIQTQFPELVGVSVTLLGEGSDHRAFSVGERSVFRFPKHVEAADNLDRTARLTAWLAPESPLALPVRHFSGQPTSAFPAPFSGEDRLAGTASPVAEPPTGAGARLLGTFLKRLHAWPAAQAAALGLESDDDLGLGEWSAEGLNDLSGAVKAGLVPEPEGALWLAVLLPPARSPEPGRVLHGDFAAEHVLLDASGRPVGVIDWSDARLGDPAQDLAGLLHWGGAALLDAALEEYGPLDAGARRRAHFYATCRALADLSFSRETGRAAYTDAGQRALRWLGALGGEVADQTPW